MSINTNTVFGRVKAWHDQRQIETRYKQNRTEQSSADCCQDRWSQDQYQEELTRFEKYLERVKSLDGTEWDENAVGGEVKSGSDELRRVGDAFLLKSSEVELRTRDAVAPMGFPLCETVEYRIQKDGIIAAKKQKAPLGFKGEVTSFILDTNQGRIAFQ